MARMACVDLPALPLQILLRRHPEWRGRPAVVVDEDRPQGRLLWVNEAARRQRVLPGMRYAAALSLARELRAGTVAPAEITTEIETLQNRLRFFSPEVERAPEEPGTFYLGAEGLGLLHPELARWAELIRDDLRQAEYAARVAVGFSRFGCYAAARAVRDQVVFADPEDERVSIRRIPLDRIGCDPGMRDTLARLGIEELGGFLDLPPLGIRRRFGEEAFRLHRLAHGDAFTPLAPEIPEDPYERRVQLEHAETDRTRLLRAITADLLALLDRLQHRDRSLAVLAVELHFDRPEAEGHRVRLETLQPASPTCELKLLLDLVRLRLESIAFPAGVVEVRLEAGFVATTPTQMELFPAAPQRDLEAANRALARLRAEFGEAAVTHAELVEAHLPEAHCRWEPLRRLAAAEPRAMRTPPLVRRILAQPKPLAFARPGRTVRDGAGNSAGGVEGGTPLGLEVPHVGRVVEATGPYLVSGGWWRREVERSYWYARTEGEMNAWLWIYHDVRRRRWLRQGEVE